MSKTIGIRVPFNSISGYGVLTEEFFYNENLFDKDVLFYHTNSLRNLKEETRNVDYLSRVTEDYQKDRPDIEILVHPLQINQEITNILTTIPYHSNRLMFTMWETTSITPFWVDLINRKLSGLIVPSQWNIDNFRKDGVTIPMYKCPLFADETYTYKKPDKGSKLIIGTAAGNSDERKNLYRLQSIFNSYYGKQKDVELHLKLPSKFLQYMPRYLNSNFKVICEDYTKEQMRDWYHGLDVFVSLSKSEGWGMMQHEAMSCGRPVICCHYAGVNEFVNKKNSIPIKYSEVYPEDSYYGYSNGKWAEPDYDDFVKQVDWSYKSKRKLNKMGKEAYNSVSHLRLSNTIETLNGIIKQHEKVIVGTGSNRKLDGSLFESDD